MSAPESWRYAVYCESATTGQPVVLHTGGPYATRRQAEVKAGRMLGYFVEQEQPGRVVYSFVDLVANRYWVEIGRTKWEAAPQVQPVSMDDYDEDGDPPGFHDEEQL